MSEHKRIVIVGGVAGGASAAARARRLAEEAEIVMFERGGDVSFANCGLPYHIGGVIADRKRLLVTTADALHRRYRIDVRTRHEVTAIDPASRRVTFRRLDTGEQDSISYDALILSPGAEPVRPPIPGADSPGVFTLRNMADMDAIIRAIDERRPERAVVVGGGYIGLEMAEALRERRLDVSLVELADQVFIAADPEMVAPIHQQLTAHGVELRLGTSVTGIEPQDGRLGVLLSTGERVPAGMVIMAVGVNPEVKLARDAGLTIGPTGGIVVDERMRTSDPNVFAVGDSVEVTHLVDGRKTVIPLAGPANRQGRIAADNALGRPSKYANSQGTAICKVFDLAIGMTGLGEKALKASGRSYEMVYVHPASHAGYYPGAKPLSLKLLFDPESGKVLGAQAVGADGVDKRIDVLAVAIRAGLTVDDLAEQELCYAPPYGSAKDPINYAGFVAGNVLRGDVALCHADECVQPGDGQLLLDVRTADEVKAGTIPGSVHIPIDDLRERIGELPRDREILAFCQVGLRGYLACRILGQHGFRCRNLTGGYKTYKSVTAPLPSDPVAAAAATERAACEATAETTDDTGAKGPTGGCCAQSAATAVQVAREIDARGLACPGPILQLRAGLDGVADGQAVRIAATDPGFGADVEAWCESTGNRLLDLAADAGTYRATVERLARPAAAPSPHHATNGEPKDKTIVLFSGDLDRALAAFIIANGAATMGGRVTIFFTFWGLNVLRRPEGAPVRKTLIERMFGWMMPRGPERLKLSKMHMGGMGAAMIKGILRKKGAASLPELIESAKRNGVRLVACTMTMDLMGFKRDELIDGVEEGGVAMYLNRAESGNVNLFI